MMRRCVRHAWNVTPREAVAIQRRLAARLCLRDDFGPLEDIRAVAGSDVAFERRERWGRAAVVVFSFPELEEVESATWEDEVRFPYIPGLLSFREAPLLVAAFRRLRRRPDLLIHDGQGYAHPRRLGIASHLGLLLDLPAIGCAKSRLIGEHPEPAHWRGAFSPLRHRGEVIGAVVRTRAGVRPVYVSCGHRVSLRTAVEIVLRCCTRYRLPEPTRRAHQLASAGKSRDISA